MSRIVDIRGREIIDSRGNPTVEADVMLESGVVGRAAVPSGASTGIARGGRTARRRPEALSWARGCCKAVGQRQYGSCARCSSGSDAQDQAGLDARMIAADGTDNKSKLGANAILAVSLAAAHAAARDERCRCTAIWAARAT